MRIGLLGELEVLDDQESQVTIAGAKLRALLAVLALHVGRVVPAEHLIDALWGTRHDWQAIYVEPGPKAVVGASAGALDADSVERTVQLIGSVGGLLADLGFQVCPASALTEGTLRPSVLA